jgi:hypothetical protein
MNVSFAAWLGSKGPVLHNLPLFDVEFDEFGGG